MQQFVHSSKILISCPLVARKARNVFTAMFPDEEFLPRAPEPDEIVYAADPKIDEQENGVKEDDSME